MSYYSKKVPQSVQSIINLVKGPSLQVSAGGDMNIINGRDKIREDVINLFSIEQGDIFFNPVSGSDLTSCLFQPNDFVLRDTLHSKVCEAIVRDIPQVQVSNVEILQDYDSNYVSISVDYVIVSLGLKDSITVYKDIRERFGGEV